jgi:7-carboxy-7-deazaguanine synthase
VSYTVKEIFYTLQGEGANTGRAAVFCRFAGCNLWSGREADRTTATCQFCDTEFVGVGPDGGRFESADALADAVEACRRLAQTDGEERRNRFVVCTGGEPLLQLDRDAIAALHARGFTVAIETNGTLVVPAGVDWVCVSPKADAELVVIQGDELKLVYPQRGAPPDRYAGLPFRHFFLQPKDGPEITAHTRAAAAYCLAHPQWRLSVQTHKVLGLR